MKRAKAGSYQEWAIRHTISSLLKEFALDGPNNKNFTDGAKKALHELIADLKTKLPEGR